MIYKVEGNGSLAVREMAQGLSTNSQNSMTVMRRKTDKERKDKGKGERDADEFEHEVKNRTNETSK